MLHDLSEIPVIDPFATFLALDEMLFLVFPGKPEARSKISREMAHAAIDPWARPRRAPLITIPVTSPAMPLEGSADDTAHSPFSRAGRSHFPVLFGEHASRGYVSDCSLQLVLPSAYDVPLSLHHCFEAGLGD